MPHAYSPNLSTVVRAERVTKALGITGWHLYRDPRGRTSLWWHETPKGVRRPVMQHETLAALEARVLG